MKMLASCLCAVFMVTTMTAAPAPEKGGKTAFIRVQSDKAGTVIALETATVTYKKGDVTVDLVGVIHVGDKAYYKGLQKQLSTYDALLYELVAPKGAIPERKTSMFGLIVKVVADLDMQLACINYKRPNFVHADLSFQELIDKNGGELSVGLRILADMLAKDKPADELEGLPKEMSLADSPVVLKRAFAKMLTKQMGSVQGSTLDRLLIKDRNKKVMEVLAEQMKGGKKNLAIFYGAAHMPDFETRLKNLGFTVFKSSWQTAWDLEDAD